MDKLLRILCIVFVVAVSAPCAFGVIDLGPWLQFTDVDKAVVRWQSTEPMASIVEYDVDGETRREEDPEARTSHAVELTGLGVNTTYRYRIMSPEGEKLADHDCETNFNYVLPRVPQGPSPYPADSLTPVYEAAADHILERTGVVQGYCLVLGCGEGRLAYELAKRSGLYVIGVDTDHGAVAKARAALREAGVYGARVTVRQVASLGALPFTKYFANLIVSDRLLSQGALPEDAGEMYRVLRPQGGVALIGQPAGAPKAVSEDKLTAWLGEVPHEFDREGGLWAMASRPALEGVGQWSHQYGSPDNSSRSGDQLLGATSTKQLQAQWVGRPGPRAMVDRNPRKPSPLYVNGRLFTQGLHRIIAQDAYNGAIFWSLELPLLERFNMPRDCSNWCADEDHLYMAIHDKTWRVDVATGGLAQLYDVAEDASRYDWGYVAQVGGTLYGSAVKKGSSNINFRGQGTLGWYDAQVGNPTYKVCSDSFFALDKESGEKVWDYAKGVIINPTITIAEGVVYFVESRHPDVLASEKRRVGTKKLWEDQYLVALDGATGELRWEQPLDTEDGIVTFYLLHARDKLIIGLSMKDYRLYAYNDADGAFKWEANHPWTGGDHSGHMQHPVVVGNTVFLEPRGYDLGTGALVTEEMGRHEGCATYAATEGALLYRGAGRRISLWDVETAKTTNWPRLRPGCWLSTVPGGGMVLSPEGGGGCSCGGWMETSLAFVRADE